MASSSAKFASTFAPYTPPPDDPSYRSQQQQHPPPPPNGSVFKPSVTPWFPQQSADSSSYQSGAIPTFESSRSGGGADTAQESQENVWATSAHFRVEIVAAFAYLLGPISALALLIFETQNDYARFHAYQSALLTTPLLVLRILVSLMRFPGFMRTFFTLLLVLPALYMAFRAYIDAARRSLSYFHLPYIGPLAQQWVQEE